MSEEPTAGDPEEIAAQAGFLRALARGLLFDRAAADDVAQKAMLTALKSRRAGKTEEAGRFSLSAWLAGILRNRAREHDREERRRREREQKAARPEALPSAADTVARLELIERVVAAVRALEEPYRTTVLLFFFDGLKPGAIARQMGVPVETVRTRLKRALERLRLDLDAHQGGDRLAWGVLLLPAALPPAGTLIGGIAASTAFHWFLMQGLGAIAMGTKVKLAGALVLAVAATAVVVSVDPFEDSSSDVETMEAAATPPDITAAAATGSTADSADESVNTTEVTRTVQESAHLPIPSADLPFVIRGRTLSPDGRPIGGLKSRIRVFDGYETKGVPGSESQIQSDATGQFTWALPLPKGTVTILGNAAELDHFAFESRLLVFGGEMPGALDLTFHALDMAIEGKVMNERGEPLPEAKVQSWSLSSCDCDEEGEYRLRASSSFGLMVSATAPGYVEVMEVVDPKGQSLPVTVNFRLRSGWSIRGRVRSEALEPVAGAKVSDLYASFSGTTTDSAGRYELTGLDPQRPSHEIYVKCAGFVDASASMAASQIDATLDFTLLRGATVEGVVFDRDGRPARGAEVWLGRQRMMFDTRQVLARDDGSFRFEHAPAGDLSVGAELKGRPGIQSTVTVPSDPPRLTGVVLKFAAGHFLAGRVTDRSGAPVANASVIYRRSPSDFDGHTRTDAQGRFRLESVPEGTRFVDAHAEGFVAASLQDVALDREELLIVLEHAGFLAGTVVDGETGEPIDRFRIRFVYAQLEPGERGASGYESTWADPGRWFKHELGQWDSAGEALEVGTVLGIEASAEGYSPTLISRAIIAESPDPEALVISLGQGARIPGTVVDQDGNPVTGALVTFETGAAPRNPWERRPTDSRWVARTDVLGTFEIVGASAGEGRLGVEHPDFAPQSDGPFTVPSSGAAASRTLHLYRGGIIRGAVLGLDGAQEADREVMLFPLAESGRGVIPPATRTDAQGCFEFSRLANGMYQVSVLSRRQNQSVNEFSARVKVESPEVVELCFKPDGDGIVLGRIRGDLSKVALITVNLQWIGEYDSEGPPESGMDIGLLKDRGTFADGDRFEIRGIAPGRYLVSCSGRTSGNDPWHHGRAEVRVAPGGVAEVAVRLEPVRR